MIDFVEKASNLHTRYNKIKENRRFYINYITELQNWGKEQKKIKTNLIKRPCPLCKNYNEKILFTAPVYDFVVCDNCGLIYANIILNDVEIHKFYLNNPIYGRAWTKDYENLIAKKDLPIYISIVEKILDTKNGDQACLDIGCGYGKLLYELMPYFTKVEGIELNETTSMQCEKLFGINVYKKRLEELDLPSQSYDVVILNQVIEHLNTLDLFKDIYRILKTNGIVYIGCPNMDGWSMKFLKGGHTHVSTHGHINMFNKKSINFLANRYHFDSILCTTSNWLDIGINDIFLHRKKDFIHRYSYDPIVLPLSLVFSKAYQKLPVRTNIVSMLQGGSYLEVVLKKK